MPETNWSRLSLDNPSSMQTGTRLADAKREAHSVLESRSPATRAQVRLPLGSQLHPDPTCTGCHALQAAVDGIQPGDSRGSFGELSRAVRSMAESIHTPIELHLFSDMQRDNMPASFAELALPPNVTLVLHPVAKSAVPNWTVESVNAPGPVWDPKKARVQVVVAGYDTPATTRNASLVVNGKTVCH